MVGSNFGTSSQHGECTDGYQLKKSRWGPTSGVPLATREDLPLLQPGTRSHGSFMRTGIKSQIAYPPD